MVFGETSFSGGPQLEDKDWESSACPALKLNDSHLDHVRIDCHLLTGYICIALESENSMIICVYACNN